MDGEKEKSDRVLSDHKAWSDCTSNKDMSTGSKEELTQRMLNSLLVAEREMRSWRGKMGRRRSRMSSAGRSLIDGAGDAISKVNLCSRR